MTLPPPPESQSASSDKSRLVLCPLGDRLEASLMARCLTAIGFEEAARIRRYLRWQDQQRALIGWLLLQTLLRRHGRGATLARVGHERPTVSGGEGPCDINLSHSGPYIAAVIAAGRCGVDVEVFRPTHVGVADRVFTDAEIRWMNRHEPTSERFFQLWTLKESLIKMTGEGLRAALKRYAFDPGPPVVVSVDNTMTPSWRSRSWHLGDAYLSVCVEGAELPTRYVLVARDEVIAASLAPPPDQAGGCA